jgi:hypothetical protein
MGVEKPITVGLFELISDFFHANSKFSLFFGRNGLRPVRT